MSQVLTGLFHTLLKSDSLSEDIQKKILSYAKSNSIPQLMVELLSHNSLSAVVDDELKNIDSAVVKVAWLTRPNRKLTEMLDSIKNESRVSLLKILATREDLSKETYEMILNKSNSTTLMLSIIGNSAIDADLREIAISKYLKDECDHTAVLTCEKCRVRFSKLFIAAPEFVESTIANSNNIMLLFAASDVTFIGFNNQEKLSNHILNHFQKTDKYDVTTWDGPGSYLYHLVSNLTSNGAVSAKAAAELNSIIEKILKNRESDSNYRYERFVDSAKALQQAVKRKPDDLAEKLKALSSEEDIDAFIASIEHLIANANTLSSAYRRLQSFAVGIINHQNSTPEHMEKVIDWLQWDGALTLLKQLNDNRKLAILLTKGRFYCELDFALGKTREPSNVLTIMIELLGKEACHQHTSILSSKYLTSDHVLSLPIAALAKGAISKETILILEEVFQNLIPNEIHWGTFEQISGEFNGSIAELIELTKIL
jgi:hypothetical protein